MENQLYNVTKPKKQQTRLSVHKCLLDGFSRKLTGKLALIGGSNGNVDTSAYGIGAISDGNYLAGYLTAVHGNVYCSCHLSLITRGGSSGSAYAIHVAVYSAAIDDKIAFAVIGVHSNG